MDKNDIIDLMKSRYDEADDYYSEEYTRGREDVNFAMGEQWPEKIKASRTRQNRPCLTENRVLAFINLVVNQIRQSRPTINAKPVDSEADPKVAEIYQGIIKNIEVTSDAETAYDTAAWNAVASGRGWLIVGTRYADYDSFDQEIYIDRVMNPFSVMLDPCSTRMDGSDAEYGFIVDRMTKKEFEKKYPKADVDGFDAVDARGGWISKEEVRIVDYYYKDYTTKELVEFEYQGQTFKGYKDEYKDVLEMPDVVVIRERDVEVCTIKHCKATSRDILEENEFLGKYIPIVPVYGQEAWYNDKRSVFSLIHAAKDPQRMFNYWKTASTEVIALQPKAPWVGAKGQFKSNAAGWRQANTDNIAFLQYDPVTIDGQLAPPPQRQAPPTSSGGMLQEAMLAADGIQSTLGIFNDNQGAESNGVSGKAIIARQVQGDNSTFHFVDNLATSMKQVGRILVGLIPLVYSGFRIVRVLGEDNAEMLVPLGQPVVEDKDGYRMAREGEKASVLRLDNGKYDVVVEIGASYATKRQESSNAIIELLRIAPELNAIAGDLLVANLDIPQAQIIADRIRTQMSPELLGDDLEAQRLQAMQQQLEATQQQLEDTMIALDAKQTNERDKLELERQRLVIDAQKAQADVAKTMAEIEKLRAEANVEIYAEAMKDLMQAVAEQRGTVDDTAGAMEIFLERAERDEKEAASEPKSDVTEKEKETDDDRE